MGIREAIRPSGAAHAGLRKTSRADEPVTPRIEVIDGVWHVRALPAVRQVLRAPATTTQAGFNAESVQVQAMRMPILFLDGTEHKDQRAAIARYFAPKTVATRYAGLMAQQADELVDRIAAAGEVDLAEYTLRYAVQVAAEVVGLTDSDIDGMARRLERFFATPRLAPGADRTGRHRLSALAMSLRGQLPMLAFYLRDVRPAVASRRAEPREDVISHLLERGYRSYEILIECLTYGAAGMVTTREYIGMAIWHLLENPSLRERYLAGDLPERMAVLEEILRLEPVVGHLYRRTVAPLTLHDGDTAYQVPVGALLDLYVRQANADPQYVGDEPLRLCPHRPVAKPYQAEVMSFGDGPHKCPGHAIALQESDVLLTRLLRLPLQLVSAPRIGWDELIAGYEVRNLRIRVTAS